MNDAKAVLLRLKRRMGKERAMRTRWHEAEAKRNGGKVIDYRNYYEANIFTQCMNYLDRELRKLKEN